MCVVVRAGSVREAETKMERLTGVADLIELRADFLRSYDDAEVLRRFGSSMILTLRYKAEGGAFDGGETERLAVFTSLIDKIRPAYVDVELRAAIRDEVTEVARRRAAKVILSYHNFEETPELRVLESIREEAIEAGADVAKIVTMARHLSDNLKMLNLVSKSEVPIVAFCMGSKGKISRVLAPIFGAKFTYVTMSKEEGTAPGQLTAEEVREIWKLLGP